MRVPLYLYVITLLLILLQQQQSFGAAQEYYVSSFVGNDTADCSACAPCRTPLGVLDKYRIDSFPTVNLLPGRYTLTTKQRVLFVYEKLKLQGKLQYPNCTIYDGLEHHTSVIIHGSFEVLPSDENNEAMLFISDMVFDLEHTATNWISSSIATLSLANASLINEPEEIWAYFSTSKNHTTRLALDNFETSSAHVNVTFGSSFTYPGLDYYVDVSIRNSNLANGFKITPKSLNSFESWRHPILDVRLSNTTLRSMKYAALNISGVVINRLDAESCTFAGTLQFFQQPAYQRDYGSDASTAIINIYNSTFQRGSTILNGLIYDRADFCGMNITMRYNRFMAPSQPQSRDEVIKVIQCKASYASIFYVDARANFWGDASGPFSCCSPSSRGVTVTQADASSWCLSKDCSILAAPIQGNMTSYTPSICQQDPFCPLESFPLRYSAIGICISISSIVSIIGVIFFKRINRETPQERYLLPVDNVASISRLSLLLNVALIIAASFIVITSIYIYIEYHQIHSWMLPALIFICAICGTRILCCLWSLAVFNMLKGESNLFSNTILSSVVVFFAAVWHFSSSAGVFFDGLNSAVFFWIIYASYAVVEISIGIISIVLQAKFMLQLQNIQKSVDSNPYGAITDLLSTARIRKLALAGFLISLAALIMSFILTFITSFLAMRDTPVLERLSHGATYAVTSVAALLDCIFFRRRFYDPLFGTISVSISFATIGFLIESAVFSYLDTGKNDIYYVDMGLYIASALLLVFPASVGAWLVAKLRAELTADIAQGVYASGFNTAT